MHHAWSKWMDGMGMECCGRLKQYLHIHNLDRPGCRNASVWRRTMVSALCDEELVRESRIPRG